MHKGQQKTFLKHLEAVGGQVDEIWTPADSPQNSDVKFMVTHRNVRLICSDAADHVGHVWDRSAPALPGEVSTGPRVVMGRDDRNTDYVRVRLMRRTTCRAFRFTIWDGVIDRRVDALRALAVRFAALQAEDLPLTIHWTPDELQVFARIVDRALKGQAHMDEVRRHLPYIKLSRLQESTAEDLKRAGEACAAWLREHKTQPPAEMGRRFDEAHARYEHVWDEDEDSLTIDAPASTSRTMLN